MANNAIDRAESVTGIWSERSRQRRSRTDRLGALGLDGVTRARLQRYNFDPVLFDGLRDRLRGATADAPEIDRIKGHVALPRPDDLRALPAEGTPAHEALAARGRQAIAAGEVGLVILAGGMATRFGGGVKAAVEVLPGQSFLDLKLADARRICRETGGRVPVYLLVSFATDDVVAAMAAQTSTASVPVETVPQFVSLRLDDAGEIFRTRTGAASPYAPGHGDLTFALRASGALDRFRRAGGRMLLVSNVDNLAATLDPAVIGAHLADQNAVTVEVVGAEPGDVGGAPVRVNDVMQIVEAFRFPADFDQTTLPAFNTNTFVLDAKAIDRDFDLSFFRVKKQVEGRTVIQFERLLGEITAFLPTGLRLVPRHAPFGRFQPIKGPDDLEQRRACIRRSLEARGVLAACNG
jgi:UTP--glucose-1-phosphate uridylyltransferase